MRCQKPANTAFTYYRCLFTKSEGHLQMKLGNWVSKMWLSLQCYFRMPLFFLRFSFLFRFPNLLSCKSYSLSPSPSPIPSSSPSLSLSLSLSHACTKIFPKDSFLPWWPNKGMSENLAVATTKCREKYPWGVSRYLSWSTYPLSDRQGFSARRVGKAVLNTGRP